jgi:hypothetical protein
MTEQWVELPIGKQLFTNLPEVDLSENAAALENCWINEMGSHSRFPGLVPFAQLNAGRVYLSEWQDDLVAVTSAGKVYRLDQNAAATDVTGVVPSGGQRPVFAKTDDQLVIGTGGDLIQLQGTKTRLLSSAAPQSGFVAYIDGFLLAAVTGSQQFAYSDAGKFTSWNPLSFFSAEGKPDNITAMIVTEFREILLAGPESVEQFEPYPGGDKPFFRRWSVSEGLFAPYTLVTGDGGTWGVTRFREFSRYAGQRKDVQSGAINYTLEKIDDWTDAWAAQVPALGQRWIIVQAPNATNPYGTKGVTLLFDYRVKKWAHLYGWDAVHGVPTRWPGWSYQGIWGRHFVGGDDGIIYELTDAAHSIAGETQRMLFRSGHFDRLGKIQVDNVRIRCKRGSGTNTSSGQLMLRSRRDGKWLTRWQKKDLGRAGDTQFWLDFGQQGTARTWQFEYAVTDDVPVEIVKIEIQPEHVD